MEKSDGTQSVAALMCLCGQLILAITIIGISLGVWIIKHPDASLWEELAEHDITVLISVATVLLLLLCCLTSIMVILGNSSKPRNKRESRYILFHK